MVDDDELLTLAAAAKRIGRSVDTLRRWRRDGVLAFEAPDEAGRVRVRARALLLAAAGHARDTQPTRAPTPAQAPRTQAGELDAVRAHLADTQRERDTLRAEVERLRHELASTRAELGTFRERVAALETELNGGVRGLLRGFRRR